MSINHTLLAILILAFSHSIPAQEMKAQAGPVIEQYGAVYDIPDPDLPVDTERDYKVVYDIYDSPGGPEALNVQLNTIARFLNMHARAGVPVENLQVAAVIHGGASKDALTHKAYQKRFSTNNPNLDIIQKLHDAGVRFYICGQTAAKRGIFRGDLATPVGVALSAMTAFLHLQAQGFEKM